MPVRRGQGRGSGRVRSFRARAARSAAPLVAAALVVAGCGGLGDGEVESEGAGAAHHCRAEPGAATRLSIAGRPAYVEPQLVVGTPAGLVIAGSPVFEWDTAAGRPSTYERDRILGVVLSGREVTEISRPPVLGPIGTLRAARVSSERSSWLFEDVTSTDYSEMQWVGVSWAERTPAGWTPLRSLSFPPEARAVFSASSAIVDLGGELSWVLPVQGSFRVTVRDYRFAEGRWLVHAVDTVRSEATGLVETAAGLWELASGPDSAVSHRRTLRARLRGDGRGWHRLYVAEAGERIVQPFLSASGDRVTAVWRSVRSSDPVRALAVTWEGPDPTSATTRTVVPGDVVHVVPIELPGRRSLFVAHHVDRESGVAELRLYAGSDASAPTLLHAREHPFAGYFAAALTGDEELVIVGPEADTDPTHANVRSLLIRYRVTCT